MDTEQIEHVLKTMDELLEGRFPDVKPEKVLGCDILKLDLASDLAVTAHLKYMIIEMSTMNNFEPDDRITREKLMRWLGFLQGVVWSCGYFSLDDLREMNVVEK